MSIIAQKIEAARFDAEAYPQLKALAQFIDETAGEATAEACRLIEPEHAAAIDMQDAFKAGEGPVYYLFAGATPRERMAISGAPEFVAALGEAMLGGDFVISEGEAAPGLLERNLAQPFVAAIAEKITSWINKSGPAGAGAQLRFTRFETDAEAAEKALPSGACFSIALSTAYAPEKTIPTLTFCFPVSLLEDRGLMTQTRDKPPEDINAEWRARMEEHVNAASIDVDVVIDRYKALISDLTRLEIGEVVPLEGEAHQSLELYLTTRTGPVMVGRGRLGVYKKKKAVKLTSDLAAAYP